MTRAQGALLDFRVKAQVTRRGKRGPRCVRPGFTKTPWWSAARRAGPRHGPAVLSDEGTGPIARSGHGCGGFRTSALWRSAPLVTRVSKQEETSQGPGASASRDRETASATVTNWQMT